MDIFGNPTQPLMCQPTPAPVMSMESVLNLPAACPPPSPPPALPTEIRPEAVITTTTAGIEFGTWIPALVSVGTIEVAVRNAFYVKVQQLVICTFDIIVTGLAGGRNNSEIILTGLPNASIPSAGPMASSGSVSVSYFKTTNRDVRQITGTVNSNDTRVNLWCQKRGVEGLVPLTHIDINLNTVLTGTVTYISS